MIPTEAYAVTSSDVLLTSLEQPLRARVYLPAASGDGEASDATVVYLHGGGWALGDLDINDHVCRSLVEQAGVALLSLDYPLAPEHPFPAALDVAVEVCASIVAGTLACADDASAAVRGLPRRLVVGGLSAGGALAAALAARGARGEGPACHASVLICPVLDSDLSRPSYGEHAEASILTAADMAWFWSLYDPEGSARRNPDAAPLRAATFVGLPPTIIVAAGVDPLRDEAVAYTAALRHAGVDVSLDVVDGVPHGFPAVPSIRSGARALEGMAARLRSVLSS